MPKGDPIQTSFNGGIQSPLLDGHIDAPRKPSSYRDSQNLIALKQGPLVRRGGTRNVFRLKASTSSSRTKLLPFIFNDEQAYILEISGSTMRFYRNGGIITEDAADQTVLGIATGTPGVVTVTSTASYSNGGLFLLNGLTTAQELNGMWGIIDNKSGTTIDMLEDDGVTDITVLTAETIGGTLKKPFTLTIPYQEPDLFKADGEFRPDVVQSNDVMYFAHPDFQTRVLARTDHDAWTIVKLRYKNGPWQKKNDSDDTLTYTISSGNIWDVVSSVANIVVTSDTLDAASGGDANDLGTATEMNRLIMFNIHASDSDADPDNNRWRWAEITKFVDTTHFQVTVPSDAKNLLTQLAANADDWALGAYSDTTGFPSVVDIHEGRLVLGATSSEPRRVDFSAVGGFNPTESDWTPHDQKLIIRPDDAISLTIGGGRANPIQWIRSQNAGLTVGTVAAEGLIRSSINSESLTGENASYKVSTTIGSASIQPVQVNNALLFIQHAKRRMHELRYIFEDDGFASPDMTVLAEHLTRARIIQIEYQQEPINTLWVLLSDGALLGFTYERPSDILGWHRHVIGGTDAVVESIAVIPSTDLSRDELWLGVTRTFSGRAVTSHTHIERMDRWYEDDIEVEAIYQQDNGLSFAATEIAITGIAVAAVTNIITITAVSHGRSNGDKVYIKEIVGMTEINQRTFTVANKNPNDFELTNSVGDNIDGSDFTAWASGGTVQESSSIFLGLHFLQGETIELYADGRHLDNVVVGTDSDALGGNTQWQIKLPNNITAANLSVGLPSTWSFESHRFEAGSAIGTSQGKIGKIHHLVVRLFNTLNLQHSDDGITYIPHVFENPTTFDRPTPLFTGDEELRFGLGHNRERKVYLKGTGPFPVQLQALMPRIEVSDR